MSRAERTRAALLGAALDLFERQGYDATTAAEVAAAAGVTEMTFFRHFAGKAALLLEDPYDPLVAESVAATPAEWPAVVRVAEGLRQAFAGLSAELSDDDLAVMRRRLRIAAATASLRPAVAASTSGTADAVAERLAAAGEDAATARIAAVSVLAGVTESLLLWAASTPEGSEPDSTGSDLAGALDAACDVLVAGR